MQEQFVSITADELQMDGVLEMPERPVGIVLFAHGAGADSDYLGASSHATSQDFLRAGIATLRFDQGGVGPGGGSNGHSYFVRSDIVLLARQLEKALGWLQVDPVHAALALRPVWLWHQRRRGDAAGGLAQRGNRRAGCLRWPGGNGGQGGAGKCARAFAADRGRARPRCGWPEPHGLCHLALRQTTGTDRRTRRLPTRATRRPCWPLTGTCAISTGIPARRNRRQSGMARRFCAWKRTCSSMKLAMK